MSAARPIAARRAVELPPSLRTHATGVAAWARMVFLWWPLSVAAGVSVTSATSDGSALAHPVEAALGFAVAALLFLAVSAIEIRRAARSGMQPFAAGAVLATSGAAVGAQIVIFVGMAAAG